MERIAFMLPKTLTSRLRNARYMDLNLAADVRNGATTNRAVHTAVSHSALPHDARSRISSPSNGARIFICNPN